MNLSSSFSACLLLLFLSTAAVATPTYLYGTAQDLEYLRPFKHLNTYDAWYSWVEFGLVRSLTSVNADTIHQKLLEVRKKQEQEHPPKFRPDPEMLADALSVDLNVMTEIVERAYQDSTDQTKCVFGYNDPHQMNTLLEIILTEGNDAPEPEVVRNAIKEARWAIHLEKDQLKRAELEKFFIKKERHYIKKGLANELNLLLEEMKDEMYEKRDKMKHGKLDYDTVKSLQELLDQATDGYQEKTRTEHEKVENEIKTYWLIKELMEQLPSPEVNVVNQLMEQLPSPEVNVGCWTSLCMLPRLLYMDLMSQDDDWKKYDVIKQLMDKLIWSPEREEKGDMTPDELEIWCNKQCMTKLSLKGATLPPCPYTYINTKRVIKWRSDEFIALALREYDDDERMIPLLRDGLKEHRVSESKIQEAMQVARRTNNVKTAVKEKTFLAAMKYLEDGGRLEKTWTLQLLEDGHWDLHWHQELVQMLEQRWLETGQRPLIRVLSISLDTLCVTLAEDRMCVTLVKNRSEGEKILQIGR